VPVILNPREHLAYAWLPWAQAAAKCFSWSNRQAIELLPERFAERARRKR
jgi:dATP pyrophosphohydrolase